MQSKAKTVAQYLRELPSDRRATVEAVRKVVLDNLDPAFEEGMQYGMIGWYVPHSVFPDGYHCDPKQPLPFACLASQKNHLSLYLMSAYGEGLEENWFRAEWAKSGKKLDMGKCCVRFKKLEDLALDVIGKAVCRVTAVDYINKYKTFLKSRKPVPRAEIRAAVAKRSKLKKASKKAGKTAKPTAKKSPPASATKAKSVKALKKRKL